MKSLFLIIAFFISANCMAQTIVPVLQRAFTELETDPQLRHALIGFYVADKSGKTVYERNGDVGMAPASTLKIVTSVSAFELLGKDFKFKTQVAINSEVRNGTVSGDIYFVGGGDPTLGSSRWSSTKPDAVMQNVRKILADKKIKKISGRIVVDQKRFLYPPIPTSWIWEDVGNYYGAGAWGLSWLENKYAVNLASDPEINKPTRILSTSPPSLSDQITNHILSAAKGSGDNAYLFSAPYSERIFATGTIPAGSNNFTIYGAIPDPGKIFRDYMEMALSDIMETKFAPVTSAATGAPSVIGTVYSPSLDSINHWFLKESINLFGEAMINNMAIEQGGKVSTAAGVEILRDFWSRNGIAKAALKVLDGSGLSPANRITPRALVHILQFAKGKIWFQSFYHALPELNGIKMKSGYIGGVRSYSGYVKSKSGEEYTFAFIINNFDGPASSVREKMYRVLNLLK